MPCRPHYQRALPRVMGASARAEGELCQLSAGRAGSASRPGGGQGRSSTLAPGVAGAVRRARWRGPTASQQHRAVLWVSSTGPAAPGRPCSLLVRERAGVARVQVARESSSLAEPRLGISRPAFAPDLASAPDLPPARASTACASTSSAQPQPSLALPTPAHVSPARIHHRRRRRRGPSLPLASSARWLPRPS